MRRIVAPNPGPLTGPGTNTYLVGIDEVAVIDPGPDDKRHIDAIVGASMQRAGAVGAAHPHPPRPLRPAPPALVKATGAEVLAFGKRLDKDADLDLDLVLGDGDTIDGTEFRLEVLHTPGPRAEPPLLPARGGAGALHRRHVLNGMTTVVNPQRGGDMAQYLASLERLREDAARRALCPGHGDVIEEPGRGSRSTSRTATSGSARSSRC